MIFSGLELMGEIPFTDVIITSTVLAPDGRRMSKSLGTGIDPLEAVAQHGADATRYGLLKISSTQDVRFSWGAIEEGRKLANKLWNASRLLLSYAEGSEPELRPRELEERWILARLDAAREQVDERTRLVRVLPGGRRALPPDLRRLLRLVPRGDQATAARRRPGRARDRARRARAAARAPAPGDAARDRGDLVEPAGPRVAPDRRRRGHRGLTPRRVRRGQTSVRSSGSRTRPGSSGGAASRCGSKATSGGSSRRSFGRSVRRRTATPRSRSSGSRGEVQRAEKMLANERFVANAPAEKVEEERDKLARYRRELDALES